MANPDPAIFYFIAVFAVIGIVFGLVLIARGFANLGTRRFVEGMPPSTIRAMALGPVELNGSIGPGLEIPDPVFGRPCVFHYEIVEHRVLTFEDNSIGFKWVTLHEDGSGKRPFWMTDGTGQTLVWAPDAELKHSIDLEFCCGFWRSVFGKSPELEFVRKVKKQRVFLRRSRLYLQVLRPGHSLFVVGTATTLKAFVPADRRFTPALDAAAAIDNIRIVGPGETPFIIAASRDKVTERRAGMFLQALIGSGLVVASLLAMTVMWRIGLP